MLFVDTLSTLVFLDVSSAVVRGYACTYYLILWQSIVLVKFYSRFSAESWADAKKDVTDFDATNKTGYRGGGGGRVLCAQRRTSCREGHNG